jgi:hypothetical protein
MKKTVRITIDANNEKETKELEVVIRDKELVDIFRRHPHKIHKNKKKLIPRKQKNNQIDI